MKIWRTSLWYIQAFWQKYKKLLLLGIAVGIVIVWLFPRFSAYLPQQKKTQYIGRVGLYTWIDLPLDIREKMSVGLTSLDDSGRPVPVLADRWSVEEDGKVFRFLLKKDLRWQDGKPFTSKDVEYNFGDVQTIHTDNEVVFRLNDAYAPFPVVVSQPLFREVKTRRFGILSENQIIGLGEYRVVSLHYKATYVDELIIENDKERLVYRFFPSEKEALTAFRLGRVDTLEQLSGLSDMSDKEKSIYKVTEDINLNQYVTLLFNTSNPDLVREVRQALNYATHKPEANAAKLRAISPIAPTSWAYNATDEMNPFSFDLAKAVDIYTKVNPQQPLHVVLDTAVTLFDDAQQVATDWQALGQAAQAQCEQTAKTAKPADKKDNSNTDCGRFAISVEVRLVRDLQDVEAVLIGREVPPDPDQYSWWHSNQSQNISRYQNPRVDKLLEDARKEPDQQKRKILYFEFQKYLVEDAPAMFLYYVPQYKVERKSLL